MTTTQPHQTEKRVLLARARKRGFTLVEAIVATAVTGVLMALVAGQTLESVALNLRITDSLEHSRNARELIDTLSADLRAAQVITLYPSFSDRSTEARDGQTGNYLVLQNINDVGTITRTVGYYTVPMSGASGWTVRRHDSDLGDNAADGLPATGSAGSHRLIKRALRLPASNCIFRCSRDRGISVQGEFVPAESLGTGRAEFIRFTVLTRS